MVKARLALFVLTGIAFAQSPIGESFAEEARPRSGRVRVVYRKVFGTGTHREETRRLGITDIETPTAARKCAENQITILNQLLSQEEYRAGGLSRFGITEVFVGIDEGRADGSKVGLSQNNKTLDLLVGFQRTGRQEGNCSDLLSKEVIASVLAEIRNHPKAEKRVDTAGQDELLGVERQIRDLQDLAFGDAPHADQALQKQATEKKKNLAPTAPSAPSSSGAPVLQGQAAE